MNALEEDGLIVEGTRANVLNNQVVVIKRKDTESEVTGLADIGKASSLALADGSVPVGKYTRQALMNLGILAETEDPSVYTTQEVSDALGGVPSRAMYPRSLRQSWKDPVKWEPPICLTHTDMKTAWISLRQSAMI